MANQQNSKIASYLSFFINPKYEDQTSFLASQKVCACVDAKVKEQWSKEKYDSLEKELEVYSDKMDKFFKQPKLDIAALSESGLPKPSSELQRKLKDIIPFISLCENEVGTEVEF